MDENNQAAANAPAAVPQGPPAADQPPPNDAAAKPAALVTAAKPKRQKDMSFHNSRPSTSDAHGMLEAIERLSLYAKPRPSANLYVPDSSMLFHTLGACDELMNTNEQFLCSNPAWLPIVSQLYISVLWVYHILRAYVSSGHGFHYAEVVNYLDAYFHIQECPVPGPLVPFFQSLSAAAGPFEWTGDIVPFLPDFTDLWNAQFYPFSQYARQVPMPVIILDQLHRFAMWNVPANETLYDDFLWYNNVFGEEPDDQSDNVRIGPQLCGNLHTTEDQLLTAHRYWRNALATGITATDADGTEFNHFFQLLGFRSQNNRHQTSWFQHVTNAMQPYCNHFTGSLPLRRIAAVGYGAGLVTGMPRDNEISRDWIYPGQDTIMPFSTAQNRALHPIPDTMTYDFVHADPSLETQMEQLSMLAHSNIMLGDAPLTQHNWLQIRNARTHRGDYWSTPYFRSAYTFTIAPDIASTIAEECYLPDAS